MLTAIGAGCTFSGKLVQHGTTGIYDLQAAVSGNTCALSPLKGIVLPLSYLNKVPQLAVELDSAGQSQSAVMIVVKK